MQAASELDAELARFEDGVTAFQKLPLSSRKNLDRASQMLEELANSEGAMGTQIQALVKAIQATRDRQLARVDAIRAKAEELKARSAEFRDLLAELEAIGAGAAELNKKLQGSDPTVVVDVGDEIGALGAKAQALFTSARTRGFDDVAHMIDTLRQQLDTLREKLSNAQPRPQ